MTGAATLPALIERFFTQRLMRQRNTSTHTIASYRDTFRLLFAFAQTTLDKLPSRLDLADLDAPFIFAFLDDLEVSRAIGIKMRNLRLTAIRAFFRFAALEEPSHGGQIQRVLAIPAKLHDKREMHFLTRAEINALLAAPDRSTWIGQRDHMLLHLAPQTGLRLSEIIRLEREEWFWEGGAPMSDASANAARSVARRSPGRPVNCCRLGSRRQGRKARRSYFPTFMAARFALTPCSACWSGMS
nr:site-specific integrase [Novosphingobium rosa]